MLGLHFIDQRVASDDARVASPQNEFQMFGARVPFPNSTGERSSRVWMYLDNTTLMVDGLGTGAAVIEPDITVTNGVVHIIGEIEFTSACRFFIMSNSISDKILGVPAQTIQEKLEMDPMMS